MVLANMFFFNHSFRQGDAGQYGLGPVLVCKYWDSLDNAGHKSRLRPCWEMSGPHELIAAKPAMFTKNQKNRTPPGGDPGMAEPGPKADPP